MTKARELQEAVHKLGVGSPEWRDAKDKLFDYLIDHPEEWAFAPNESDIRHVREAHEEYMTTYVGQNQTKNPPDVSAIRLLISNSHFNDGEDGLDTKAMNDFWEDFKSDQPEVFKGPTYQHSLGMAWVDYKLKFILESQKLPFIEWDQQELIMVLKSPDSLVKTAQAIRTLMSKDWELYHFVVEKIEDNEVARYFFKRPKKRDVFDTVSEMVESNL